MQTQQLTSVSTLQLSLIIYHSARIGLIADAAMRGATQLIFNGLNANTWPVFLDVSFDFILFMTTLWLIRSVWRKRNLTLNLVILIVIFFATHIENFSEIVRNSLIVDRKMYIEQLVASISYLILNLFGIAFTFLLSRKSSEYDEI
jgi:hypothetical protein